jgi:hypothetical protein
MKMRNLDDDQTIYHNNAIKLTTASTGVNVLGLWVVLVQQIFPTIMKKELGHQQLWYNYCWDYKYFQQAGTYTKVGRLVTVQIFLNITGQTGAGVYEVGGISIYIWSWC